MSQDKQFRFSDSRGKYLLFVTTSNEKAAVAERVSRELGHLKPSPPALKVFDAGMGDGTVLTKVMRDLHHRFPTIPFLVVAKEISLEDVRISLNSMADRFAEHPQTVLVATNMKYTEAPSLQPTDPAVSVKRWDVKLEGQSAHHFDEQLRGLNAILEEGWAVVPSEKTGNPLYKQPSVVVIYREDHEFSLNDVIPSAEARIEPAYDLVLAVQPFRARASAKRKIKYVLKPLAEALGKHGRMVVIQSAGYDPGMEIIRKIWPDEKPFQTPRHELIETMREMLPTSGLTYCGTDAHESNFQYELYSLTNELTNIGTSSLLTAWNAAVYVAQIDDARVEAAMADGSYLEATREVLQQHGGLWFMDESFVVCRG